MSEETADWGGPTDYGFTWGPMGVVRCYRHEPDDTRVVTIETEHRKLEVAVSAKGRSVRVWLDGKRMVPDE